METKPLRTEVILWPVWVARMATMRSVICTVMGHVDHGKSSILDTIRGTSVVSQEAGQITQAIGASLMHIDALKKLCMPLLKEGGVKIRLPGVLMIDTPGHAAFTHLRKRGGTLSDIAILVIDINEGFKPQTLEALEILKSYRTPFIIAANKIDLLPGWRPGKQVLLENISSQSDDVKALLDTRVYQIVARLQELGLDGERFDRVPDYTKQIAIIPCSAKTGECIPELLLVLTGLAQKFLEAQLEYNPEGLARATILEVKQEPGFGQALDLVLHDGTLRVNDMVVVGTLNGAVEGRVKAILECIPVSKHKLPQFRPVKAASAASAVRVSVVDVKDIVAGMPLWGVTESTVEQTKEELRKEIEAIFIETDQEGVIVKADALGSLEAMINILRQQQIPIRRALIGNITRKDVFDADSNIAENPLYAAVLGFNVRVVDDAQTAARESRVKIITSEVIYKIIEDYQAWQKARQAELQQEQLIGLESPVKLKILRGYVFRQNNPAVVGVEILEGKLKVGQALMKETKPVTVVKQIQEEKESIQEAERGKQVSVSLDKVTMGRQLHEEDVLYSVMSEETFRKLKQHKDKLSGDQVNVLKEIAEMMRRENPLWGM